jgi:hypothetical protein
VSHQLVVVDGASSHTDDDAKEHLQCWQQVSKSKRLQQSAQWDGENSASAALRQ